jgi:hypothetical protein
MSGRRASGGDQGDEHDHGPVDWFQVLDVAVWVAVAVVLAIGADLLFGKIMRERLARGASRYLAKMTAGQTESTTE